MLLALLVSLGGRMKDYGQLVWTRVPAALRKRLKLHCVRSGISMRDFAAAAVQERLKARKKARVLTLVLMAVLVRWLPSPSFGVVGYRVWVNGVPSEAGLPWPRSDGALGFIVPGLDSTAAYIFSVTAYTAMGEESDRSNDVLLGGGCR